MKIQICTISKRIQVLDECSFAELVTQLEAMLPDWKEYKLTTKIGEEYSNPIIIERYIDRTPTVIPTIVPVYPYHPYPHEWYPIYTSTDGNNTSFGGGLYNLQIDE